MNEQEWFPETMSSDSRSGKVPAVTFSFWVVKVAATTLGETGGDTVTMTWDLGYLIGTAIFMTALIAMLCLQIASRRFHPSLYWATIIASTTAGTTMADWVDRSLGLGYAGGSLILLGGVLASLLAWHLVEGTVSARAVSSSRAEAFYWTTITFSQTLGTALGDWAADSGLGYLGGAAAFGGALALVGAAYRWTSISRVGLFWLAFILSRPLGATVGDFLDKPLASGGLDLSRPLASAVLLLFIVACVLVLPQHAENERAQPGGRQA